MGPSACLMLRPTAPHISVGGGPNQADDPALLALAVGASTHMTGKSPRLVLRSSEFLAFASVPMVRFLCWT